MTKQDKMSIIKEAGIKESANMDLSSLSSLSPYVELIGTLHTRKWRYDKIVNKQRVRSGKVIGYRFKAHKPINNITKMKILDANKVATTDPSGYEVDGSFNVTVGEEFNLNLMEMVVFFMRNDIMGSICYHDKEYALFVRATKQDYITAGLQAYGDTESVKFNEIYIDDFIDGVLTPIIDIEGYDCLYNKKRKYNSKAGQVPTPVINALGLRAVLPEELWAK